MFVPLALGYANQIYQYPVTNNQVYNKLSKTPLDATDGDVSEGLQWEEAGVPGEQNSTCPTLLRVTVSTPRIDPSCGNRVVTIDEAEWQVIIDWYEK